jgi:hypothetical protein
MHNYIFPGMMMGWLSIFLLPLVVWSIFWKGMALWKAAKNESKGWFILLLVLNTLGILDMIYIFVVSKKTAKKERK